MKYVYILQSLADTQHFYTGITDDLKARLSMHSSGAVTHTAEYRPWRLRSYVPFTDEGRAAPLTARQARYLWRDEQSKWKFRLMPFL